MLSATSRHAAISTPLIFIMLFFACAGLPAQNSGTVGPPAQTQGPPKLPPELQKISDQYAKAVKLHSQKQYPEALAAYQEFIKMAVAAKAAQGAILAAYTNMAMIYQATDDKKHYLELLHKINAMDPKNARVLAQLAISESGDHHYDAAATYANKTLALKPTDEIASSVHFVKGTVFVAHKDYAAAAREFGDSARLTPKNALSHFNYGLALAQTKRYNDAKKQLDIARRLDPANPRIKEYSTKLDQYLATINTKGLTLPPTEYDAILKKDPKNGPALLGRARKLEAMGRGEDAISAYIEAIAVLPDSYEAHFNVAKLYVNVRLYQPAKEHFQKAQLLAVKAKDNAKQAQALAGLSGAELSEGLGLGDFRQRKESFTAAETHIKQAIALEPAEADMKVRLGRVYEAQSRFADAEAVYREMLKTRPDDVSVYTHLANTYKSRAQVDEFVKVWKEYQARRPDDPTSYEYITDVYNLSGKYDKAVESVDEMLKRKLTNSVIASARVVKGKDLNLLRKPEEAKAEFKAVLAMSPSNLEPKYMLQERAALEAEQRGALTALAAIARNEHKPDEAIGYMNELKKREAEVARQQSSAPNGEIYKEIAALYEQTGRMDLAIAEYQALAKVVPGDPSPHRELARIYEGRKMLDMAVQEYTRAADLDIKDPVPDQMKIAEMYQRNQMPDKALTVLQALYSKNLKNVEVMTLLAQVYRQLGQDEKALGIYAALISVNPALTWVQDSRAESLVRLKRFTEAEAIYTQEIDRNPTAGRQTYASLLHVYQLENRSEKFLEFLKPRFEKSPANATVMAVVYDEYVRTGNEAAGQAYILGVIDKLKNIRRVCLEAYAELLQVHKHMPESLELYRTIAKENSKDVTAWMNLADQLDFNGKQEEANGLYIEQAARTDIAPLQKANLQRRLAMRYAQQNRLPEARSAFQKIFDADKRDFDAGMRLGDVIERTGATNEAIAFYSGMLKTPEYPLIVRVDLRNRLGALYVKIDKKTEALEQFRETLKLDPENSIALAAVKKLSAG